MTDWREFRIGWRIGAGNEETRLDLYLKWVTFLKIQEVIHE
jgi:hypothetical protein